MSHYPSFVIIGLVMALAVVAGCTSIQDNAAPPVFSLQTSPTAASPASLADIPLTALPVMTVVTTASGTCPPDVRSDPANCGACGNICPSNAICEAGLCYCKDGYTASNNQCTAVPAAVTIAGNGCPSGMSPCPDGYCYDLASTAANCGACGNVCAGGLVCSASTCSSPAPIVTTPVTAVTTLVPPVVTTTTAVSPGVTVKPGLTLAGSLAVNCAVLGKTSCSGTCVNTSADAANCGSCGNACTASAPSCCNGGCVNFQNDATNCGSCGHACGSLSTCSAGACTVKTVVRVPVTLVQPVITTIPVYQPIYRPVMP